MFAKQKRGLARIKPYYIQLRLLICYVFYEIIATTCVNGGFSQIGSHMGFTILSTKEHLFFKSNKFHTVKCFGPMWCMNKHFDIRLPYSNTGLKSDLKRTGNIYQILSK